MAAEVFKNYYEEDTVEFTAVLDRLLAAVDYNTLLIELFAKNMKILARNGKKLADMLTALELNGLFLEGKSFMVATQYTGNSHKAPGTTDDILGALYEHGKLSAGEQRYLVTIALMPATNHKFDIIVKLVADDEGKAGRILYELTQKGWLNGTDSGYRMSQVIQHVTLNKYKESLQDFGLPIVKILCGIMGNDIDHLTENYYHNALPYSYIVKFLAQKLRASPYLSYLCSHAGDFYLHLGDFTDSIHLYELDAIFCRDLLGQDRNNIDHKNRLAISYTKLGDVNEKMGDLNKALEFYNKRSDLIEQLLQTNPLDMQFICGLAISYGKLGGIYEKMWKLNKAQEFYTQVTRLFVQLHDTYPMDLAFTNGLATSYSRLGGVYEEMGDFDKALSFYNKRNDLGKQLHDANPKDVAFTNGMANSYERLGGIYEKMEDLDQALEYFKKRNDLGKQLHDTNPMDVDFNNGLAISYSRLGFLLSKMDNAVDAKQNYLLAQGMWQEMVAVFPDFYEVGQNLGWVNKQLAQME